MTVKELYLLAKEKGILDYEIEIQYGVSGGFYQGTRDIDGLEIEDNNKIIVV